MLKGRDDFVMIFDVTDGNPNGNPDAGNAPRVDAETGVGIVTDVYIKRKIRNYVQLTHGDEAGFDILIRADRSLNTKFRSVYESLGLKTGQKGKIREDVEAARRFMCQHYYDVRTFRSGDGDG